MCGIFGYVGTEDNASGLVFDGLKTLEYRGYDSWGVAIKPKISNKENIFSIEKRVGKIGKDSLGGGLSSLSSTLGIGHTRWATHGGVTVANAHPHLDCTKKIAVVHNGIIENYEGIKEELIKKGHKFVSETDTEVIPHMVEENLKREGFASSVRDAFNRIKGFNAIVVSYGPSSEIVACKNGSPLIIGVGREELLIASDVSAISPYTKKVVFLKDNEMAILGEKLQVLSLPKGKKLKVATDTINFDTEESKLGRYPHFMLKEIFEQPKVIRNIAENYGEQVKALARIIKNSKGTFFIGAGSAYYACLAGVYFFSKIAKKHVNTVFASEFNYLEDFLNKDSLVIALSQSGETIDVIEPLARAKKKKSKIAGITNVLGSTIYRMADYKMLLGAGPEKAVASTKAYVAKLSVLLMLSYAFLGKGALSKQILLKTARDIEKLLERGSLIKLRKIARVLAKSQNIFIIGRGVSYPISMEAAMKIKEVSYIHAEGLAGGELKHGSIALISKGTPCLVFAPNDETYDSIISNTAEVRARGGKIIGISFKNSPLFDYFVKVDDIGNGSYITQVIIAQVLAYYIAISKKLDPDKPRNLAKSVTVK